MNTRGLLLASLSLLAVALGGCAATDDAGADDESVDSSAASDLTEGCASCTIVPQKSIRSITLDMTVTALRAKLGAPSKIAHATSEIAGPYKLYTYGLTEVTIYGDHVGSVFTRSPKVKTSAGIGVGSAETEVEAKVPGVKCATESGYRSCTLGKQVPGETITSFTIRDGKVASVLLGYIID